MPSKTGPPETLEIIAQVVKELDENPGQERQICLYPLKNANAENSKYQRDLERLRATLGKWIRVTGGRGEISEDQQLTAKRFLDRQAPPYQ